MSTAQWLGTEQEEGVAGDGQPTRKALGRGLAALIPGASSPGSAGSTAAGDVASSGLRTLPIERIEGNPEQPRKSFDQDGLEELASSIREHGVLQPIIVRRHGARYQIVAGERRWRAAARAGLKEVPVLVKDLADADVLAVALVENIQRRDLDPLEEADAYRRLIDEHSLSHEQVAQAVGKSRVAVTNSMRLLKLPAPVLSLLGDGRLTAGHARALMIVSEPKSMEKLADEVIRQKMSVRDTERRARAMRASDKKVKGGALKRTPEELALEERLQKALGTKVRLHHRAGKGKIEIVFHSLEHLDEVVDRVLR